VVRAEREHCCNDWAAARLGNAHRYASALATLEESPWRAPRTAMAANGSNLLRRIRRLLAKPDARDLAVPVLPSMLLVISVGVALAAWSPDRPLRKIAKPDPAAAPVQLAQAPAAQRPRLVAQVQQMAPAPLQESGSTSSNDSMGWPYQRWLNEDVVYIITPEERSAFRKLLTDAEREQFIQQFWQRRDPTPATSQNEFKDEHYRRIAYANERFSSSDGRTPGWRTGRGRFYITYGPPDELDDHTNGDPNPYQIWQYRYIDGFGANVQLRFTIDPTGGSHLDQIVSPSPVATFEATANSGKARRSSVQIYPGGNVTFSIREDFSAGPFDSIGNIRTAQGTEVANFMDTGSQSDSLNRRSTFALAPGSYVFSMRLKDRSTGQIHNEEYPFEVK
jgi:GWxTD domain-containing protein